jgi:HD superfamily phosphohydrolase
VYTKTKLFGGFLLLVFIIGLFFFVPKKHSLTLNTIYGVYTVTDPAIIDLIKSNAVQRLKKVDQYGIFSIICKEHPSFTRYEHSIGVFVLLRRFGASREEQIAGLLHDVSHTVFSHVGDYVFKHFDFKKSYQDDIHEWYLKQTDVPQILQKHGLSFDIVNYKNSVYRLLEQDLPDICADRLEYNLRGGLVEGLINEQDVEEILDDITFENGIWLFHTPEIARKFLSIPLYLTQYVWGSIDEYFISSFFAHALRRAVEIGLVKKEELHFSTDKVIWDRLLQSDDSVIKEDFTFVKNYKQAYHITSKEHCDNVVVKKFRGIDPLLKQDNGTILRLSMIDKQYARDYWRKRKKSEDGFFVKISEDLLSRSDYVQEVFG